jgi:hypothetical protein
MVHETPHVFTTLIIGLLLAIAFQLLLTNLGVAVGITALGLKITAKPEARSPKSTRPRNSIRTIGIAAGLGILTTLNVVLFIACFLSVRLSVVTDPILGAILGIVIWSAYLLLLVWISSTAVNSLIGALFHSLTASVQTLINLVIRVFNHDDSNSEGELSESEMQSTVRQEVHAALADVDLQGTLASYLEQWQPPQIDLERVHQDLEQMLTEANLRSLPLDDTHIDRQTFVELLGDRTDLSKRDCEQLVDQLETLWRQAITRQPDLNTKLLHFLQSAPAEDLKFGQLTDQLKQWLAASPQSEDDIKNSSESEAAGWVSTLQKAIDLPKIDLNTMKHTLLQRIDLSDWDVEQIWRQLHAVQQYFSSRTEQDSTENHTPDSAAAFSTIRADIEDYLLHAYPWNLDRKTVQLEFEDVLYDPEAAPSQIQQQLEQIQRDNFVAILQQRDDLSSAKIDKIADRLEKVRLHVLERIAITEADDNNQSLQTYLEAFFRETHKPSLKSKPIQRMVYTLMKTFPVGIEPLVSALSQFDQARLQDILMSREDLSTKQQLALADQLIVLRDRLIRELQTLPEQLQTELTARQQKLLSYLRHTSTERLVPKQVRRKLQNLLQDLPVTAVSPQFQQQLWQPEQFLDVLERRQGLTSDQIQQIITQIETTWNQAFQNLPVFDQSVVDQPVVNQQSIDRHTTAQSITQTLADYLHKLDWTDLNLADLKQHLTDFLSPLQLGTIAVEVWSLIDWDMVSDRLRQRADLTDIQVHQILDRLREVTRQLLRQPRRRATRSSIAAPDFTTIWQEFWLNADRSDLVPDKIQTYLRRLFQDHSFPLLSEEADLPTPFDQITDQATLLSYLQERGDVTDDEAQQIMDATQAVYQYLQRESQSTQASYQSLQAAAIAKIRHYLSELTLPNLADDWLAQITQQVLSIPQQGMDTLSQATDRLPVNSLLDVAKSLSPDALRDRLQQLNRDTFSKLIETREDVSQALADQVASQIETWRNQLLQHLEQLQHQAQEQMTALQHQAQRQAAATRKAAAIAAWWLFSIAFTSGVTSAIAGFLATH